MSEEDGVRLLLDSVARGRASVNDAIETISLQRVSDILVHELLYRSCANEVADGSHSEIPVVLILDGPSGQVEKRIVLGHGGSELPQTLLHIDAVDAAMCLFGPREAAVAPSLVLDWPNLWPDLDAFRPKHVVPPAVLELGYRITQTLARRTDPDLGRLAIQYGSDKWGAHRYTPLYEHHLSNFTNQQIRLLEIGVGGGETAEGGASLRMWKHFFPRGLIFGIDIFDKSAVVEQRISTHQVDQGDRAALDSFAREFGPFDVVIDDGSHYSSDVITSFQALFPHVRPGGTYVVEDLQFSYWPFFGGNHADFTDPSTSMGFLKQLIDGLNHMELLASGERVSRPTDGWISGMHFYHNIAFLEKFGNREPSPLARAVERLADSNIGGDGLMRTWEVRE
ncbi:MAG TPA: class I SAM-dependent methyltransferase [Actinophytocola sp.]|uniref:class I SAM-dependent methyltransferase n=1 Tax=Actinophytocola sp. TaxID=1872138 RepID=UPI002DB5E6FF|nr:class I SAM-dependent methyltransferase [Actinophytocola sp.]HEU5469266.1 class I SAM-dependent methyltransferase [Actinophytocola sp.]